MEHVCVCVCLCVCVHARQGKFRSDGFSFPSRFHHGALAGGNVPQRGGVIFESVYVNASAGGGRRKVECSCTFSALPGTFSALPGTIVRPSTATVVVVVVVKLDKSLLALPGSSLRFRSLSPNKPRLAHQEVGQEGTG